MLGLSAGRSGTGRSAVRLIGVVAVSAVMVGLTFVPIAPVQANDELVPANGTPAVALSIDLDDVTCVPNGVEINGQLNADETAFSSFMSLTDVPDGWTVRSSWVVSSGTPAVETSLGSVDTPVIRPLPTVAPPPAPYVDDVWFGDLVDAGATFTYTVTLQLFDTAPAWVQATQVTISCNGNNVPVVNVATPSAEVVSAPQPTKASLAPSAIAWGECESDEAIEGEQCATVSVPLDHFGSRGTVIDIAVNRFPATSGQSNGALLTNPGGPGVPGLWLARNMSQMYAGTVLAEDYDIIGFDPRGVGESSPAPYCFPSPDGSDSLGNVLDPDWQRYFTADVPATGSYQSMCSAATARYLGFLGSRQVAADMDWIRRAEDIGRGSEKKLAFFGGSYGTRLGEVYLKHFGNHAGAFVLSGAMDPASTYVDINTERAGPPDEVFDMLFAPAAPDGIGDKFYAVVAALSAPASTELNPSAGARAGGRASVPATVDGQEAEVTLASFTGEVSLALRSEPSWPETASYISDTYDVVVNGLNVAIETPPDPLVREPLPDGLPNASETASPSETRASLNSSVIQNTVNCLDLPGVPSSAAEMVQAAESSVPGDPVNYLGWFYPAYMDFCEGLFPSGIDVTDDSEPTKVWPALPLPEGTPAPLIIGSFGDTATPYAWSVAMHEFFLANGIDASLVYYEGAEHVAGVFWPPPICLTNIIIEFFGEAVLPITGSGCSFVSPFSRQPPENVTATAGDTKVAMSWTNPIQRLGGNVDGFLMQIREVSEGLSGSSENDGWVNVEQGSCALIDFEEFTECEVLGLTNGVSYVFRMVTLPEPEYDIAEFSEVSAAVTPEAFVPVDPDAMAPSFTG
jgi:pimeloyl-ACP methyl ester carboxylesterase